MWSGPDRFKIINTSQPILGNSTTYTSRRMVCLFERNESDSKLTSEALANILTILIMVLYSASLIGNLAVSVWDMENGTYQMERWGFGSESDLEFYRNRKIMDKCILIILLIIILLPWLQLDDSVVRCLMPLILYSNPLRTYWYV